MGLRHPGHQHLGGPISAYAIDRFNSRNSATNATIPYNEIIAPRETINANGSSVTRIVETPWVSRRQFLANMMGYTTSGVLRSGWNTTLSRNVNRLIRSLPEAANRTWGDYYCSAADLIDAHSNHTDEVVEFNRRLRFDVARYSLTYEPRPYSVLTDNEIGHELQRFVTRTQKQAVEALKGGQPGQFFYNVPTAGNPLGLGTAGPNISEPAVKLVPTRQLQYVWQGIPGYYMPKIRLTIDACLGKVNAFPFDPFLTGNGAGYPIQTILLVGATEEVEGRRNRGAAANGNISLIPDLEYRVTYSFLYRNNGMAVDGVMVAGHNHVFRPSAQAFFYVTNTGLRNGVPIYGSEDLHRLFEPVP